MNTEVLICNITDYVIGNLFLHIPRRQTCVCVTRVDRRAGCVPRISWCQRGCCYEAHQLPYWTAFEPGNLVCIWVQQAGLINKLHSGDNLGYVQYHECRNSQYPLRGTNNSKNNDGQPHMEQDMVPYWSEVIILNSIIWAGDNAAPANFPRYEKEKIAGGITRCVEEGGGRQRCDRLAFYC